MTSLSGVGLSLPSRKRRVFYSVSAIVTVMVIGIVGFHQIEGMDWVNAIYFESMLATGQGPPLALSTDAGKLFASAMGFVSFGTVLTGLLVTLVPILSQLWREGLERAERDVRELENDLTRKKEERHQ
jgi:hypothetical protein